MKEFRQFLLRGNLVDMATGIVVGVAFTAVVTAFVADLITPLIAAIGGQHDFSNLAFTVHNSTFKYGAFINALLAFVLIAAVVFFLVIKPVNRLMTRYKTEPEVEQTTKDCPRCLSAIPIAATKCAFCTADL
ncbi:MAG: large conductance mechanosensitive channel protein MscL [Actinomycetota bacterium]